MFFQSLGLGGFVVDPTEFVEYLLIPHNKVCKLLQAYSYSRSASRRWYPFTDPAQVVFEKGRLRYNQLQKYLDTPTKTDLPYFKSLLTTRLRHKILTSSSPPSKVVPPSLERGLVLLATLLRGGGRITSPRTQATQSSQNKVQCLKYFCNWQQFAKNC